MTTSNSRSDCAGRHRVPMKSARVDVSHAHRRNVPGVPDEAQHAGLRRGQADSLPQVRSQPPRPDSSPRKRWRKRWSRRRSHPPSRSPNRCRPKRPTMTITASAQEGERRRSTTMTNRRARQKRRYDDDDDGYAHDHHRRRRRSGGGAAATVGRSRLIVVFGVLVLAGIGLAFTSSQVRAERSRRRRRCRRGGRSIVSRRRLQGRGRGDRGPY